MELKTYRAKSIREALALVRRELGPDAAVLGTREVRGAGGVLGWLGGERLVEVIASAEVAVPSRLPPRPAPAVQVFPPRFTTVSGIDLSSLAQDRSAAESARRPERPEGTVKSSPAFKRLVEMLTDVETPPDLAYDLAEHVLRGLSPEDRDNLPAARSRLATTVVHSIEIAGPIALADHQRRLVALVGPTGVGKTTTIAKLAAQFRLQEHRRVGLITLDTYRIAAIDQLRTYAEIIDLPLEVVATPEEIRDAIARLADLDLILLDTAGLSPSDPEKIHELEALLGEVAADEVHLVLSCASSSTALARAAECFRTVGANRLILTKVDEAQGLGNLLPLLCDGHWPLSYLSGGQEVPGDIAVANAAQLTGWILPDILQSAA